MARPIMPFMDFSGGLNTETSNEKLQNNECTVLKNADLSNRGSVKRRTGRRKIGNIPGKGQGMFFYYRQGQAEPDLIVAVSGKLYVKEYGQTTFNPISIMDGSNTFTFQSELPIEAVQYRDELFIATGTKLVELTYSGGWKAKVMEPYKPTVLEVIHIGTNAIADNPNTWIQGKDGPTVSIEGVTASSPIGAVNVPVTFTAHVVKPANVEVNYRFSYAKTGTGSFSQVYSGSNRFANITFNDVGGYDIKAETTQKVFIIDEMEQNILWTAAPGIKIQASTGAYDAAGGYGQKCLIIQTGGTGTYDSNKPAVYRDYATPLDISKVDTFKFAFSVWNWDGGPGMGMGSADSNQLWFYAEGNLDTPVLKVDSKTYLGKAEGGTMWNYATTKFDNKVSGLNKIVRIGFKCFVSSGYVPRTEENYSGYDTREDYCTRLDDISMWLSTSSSTYTLSDYQVGGVIDPTIDPETYSAIHTSRSIRLHWDRILLAKDNKYPGQIYISDLNNPRYFPTNKRIDFSLDRKEGITAITRLKDYLVIFTKTTVSVLLGKGPQDGEIPIPDTYSVKMIHDRIGCSAERSAKVVGNEIFFLSDNGLYSLRPNDYQNNDLNVLPIDQNIKSLIVNDPNACAMVHDNQYWICFPSRKEMLRMYYQTGAWVQDTSSKLNITQFMIYTDDVYNLTDDGTICLQDSSYTDDGETYECAVQSKYFDLAATFAYKKLKRLFVLARNYPTIHVPLFVRVWSDSQIVLDPTQEKAVVKDNYVEWETTTEPNIEFENSAILGSWELGKSLLGDVEMSIKEASVRGKGKRIRVGFTHKENGPCEILGFGIEYKVRKP